MIAVSTDLEIWPTRPLIFIQGVKSAKLKLNSVVSGANYVTLIEARYTQKCRSKLTKNLLFSNVYGLP